MDAYINEKIQSIVHMIKNILTLVFCLIVSINVVAQDVYDGYTLKIPKVSVSDLIYKNVEITVGNVIGVNGQKLNEIDLYIPATNQLLIPEVLVGQKSYKNVTITVGNILAVGGSEIPVKKSSYENLIAAGKVMGSQPIPLEWKPCGDRWDCGNNPAPASGYADFLRNGTYTLLVHSLEYNAVNPLDMDRKGKIRLFEKVNGEWKDSTSKILSSNQQEGCLNASRMVVADFLQNGMPSVFFPCYGFDGPGGIGEKQRILLGQKDGTYKNIELSNIDICTCAYASAADINGDGYPDIVLTDNYQKKAVYVLINNKDGTFTADYSRFPSSITNLPYFSVELVDTKGTGKFDVLLGGIENCCGSMKSPATIYFNNGNGSFSKEASVVIPSYKNYGMVLDFLFDSGNVYISKTPDDAANYYKAYAIQKYNIATQASSIIYENTTGFPFNGWTFLNNIFFYGNDIVVLSNVYKFSTPK